MNYESLEHIVNTVPHYRGDKNRFPLGNRKHINKHFFVREEDGQRVFDIAYGYYNKFHECSESEYQIKDANNIRTYRQQKYQPDGTPMIGEYSYHWAECLPNILGTVRNDNTFQFTKDTYDQGAMTFLNTLVIGWFARQSRRGGMIHVAHSDGKKMITPIWKGMKMNLDTMKPTVSYKVLTHQVNRKAGKALLAKYEHFFKVTEVMTKNMDGNGIIDLAKVVLSELYPHKENAHQEYHLTVELMKAAEKCINDAPLDAFVLYALAYDTNAFNHRVRYASNTYSRDLDVTGMYNNLKRKFSKEMYKDNPEIFKVVEHDNPLSYPSCDWGVKIVVDGNEMEQV